ncbi:MAG: RluA family pseudouridine synthase [Erysipelotrichaceae bacterium]|nr:RluA family pseudouridine synthase [Erysipelotrichaceae bacterium]
MKPGDHLLIDAYGSDDHMYEPVFEDIDVVYEDDILLIVNKPAGLPVFPDHRGDTHSLANHVAGYYVLNGEDLPVRFIHRLDVDTSGLIIFVKCSLLQSYMDQLLAKHLLEKRYLALVAGTFKDKQVHTIKKPIGRDRHVSGKMRIAINGQQAITKYQCLQNYEDHALVECLLITGRRHQIRVHMASIDHPILGDQLYNLHPGKRKRQALMAYLLKFKHPVTQETVSVTLDVPDDWS